MKIQYSNRRSDVITFTSIEDGGCFVGLEPTTFNAIFIKASSPVAGAEDNSRAMRATDGQMFTFFAADRVLALPSAELLLPKYTVEHLPSKHKTEAPQ